MIHQLAIRNFAIVDRLDIQWRPGLNVITGETGAGKSIIVDAVGALLGDRLGAEVVRTGAERAMVEGVFVLPDPLPSELARVLDEFGLETEDGALIVTREVAGPGGRGGARVNGRTVPLTVLQELGEQLVDVHGQSQHMALLRPREQMDFLDRFGGLLAQRAEVADLVRRLRVVRDDLRELLTAEREATREQEMLRFQVAEIELVDPQPGEDEQLLAQRNRLQHVERLRQAAMAAIQALAGGELGEGERVGAVDALGEAFAACQDGARFDPRLNQEAENVNSALALAEEASRSLRSYAESIEADPEALATVEERLQALLDLKRKYGETIDDVLAYAADASRRLERYERREERMAELREEEQRLVALTGAAAERLSEARAAAGQRLARAVESELADLRMQGTAFAVSLTQHDDPHGVPLRGRCVGVDVTGADRVELLLAPNPGEEPRPMTKIASGGELARIALALKTVLSRADTRATLVFDEVDVGVGGRVAPVVGQKLWRLASHGHQVLCVTHMPQVAAYGDQHWSVAKRAADGRTRTQVDPLESEDRVTELAAMLAGSATEAARVSARELLDDAQSFKSAGAALPAAASPNGRAARTTRRTRTS